MGFNEGERDELCPGASASRVTNHHSLKAQGSSSYWSAAGHVGGECPQALCPSEEGCGQAEVTWQAGRLSM